MAIYMDKQTQKQVLDVLEDVQIPLVNIELALEQHLRNNRTQLDPQTRFLLAGVLDCIGRVALCAGEMVAREQPRSQTLPPIGAKHTAFAS